jgi:uncharacterized lipoprotein YajG
MKKAMFVVLLVAIALFAMVGTAHAAGTVSQSQSTTITASINEKVVLTISNGEVNFGPLDPGAVAQNTLVKINVRSNTDYTVSRVQDSDCTTMGLTIPNNTVAFNGTTVNPKAPSVGGFDFPEIYNITVPWTTAPGSYTGYVLYTVTAL